MFRPITGSASQNTESQRNGSITLALAGGQAAPSACMNEGREWCTVVVVVVVALRRGDDRARGSEGVEPEGECVEQKKVLPCIYLARRSPVDCIHLPPY